MIITMPDCLAEYFEDAMTPVGVPYKGVGTGYGSAEYELEPSVTMDLVHKAMADEIREVVVEVTKPPSSNLP